MNTIDLRGNGFLSIQKISIDEFKNSNRLIMRHYTSLVFLDSIKDKGLIPPTFTNKFSNKDQFVDGDEHYVYLTGNEDRVFADNAVEKFGGEPIMLDIIIDKDSIEADDNSLYLSNQGKNPRDIQVIHYQLTIDYFRNGRTKQIIVPDNVLNITFL